MIISVIVPVFNGAASLARCLHALAESQYAPIECILVDDGSTDDSASIARSYGVILISTEGRSGPATARNLGARRAQGDLVLFVDADVALHPHALGRIADRFESDPDLDALMGSYDDSPADPGFVSQFKNLMHSYVHQQGNQQAFSFWCGCGAVRRNVYLEHGGLDESYKKPSIEDIEFGFRMLKAGRKLALDPQVRCKHLKVWTLWNLVRTDVFQRGIPWTELILRTQFLPDDLNLRWSQRLSALLAGLLVLLCGLGPVLLTPLSAVAGSLACLVSIVWINRAFYRFLASRKGWRFSLAAIPLHILYYLYSGLSFALGVGAHLLRMALPDAPPERLVKSPGKDRL